jgi:hypothetical protein
MKWFSPGIPCVGSRNIFVASGVLNLFLFVVHLVTLTVAKLPSVDVNKKQPDGKPKYTEKMVQVSLNTKLKCHFQANDKQ